MRHKFEHKEIPQGRKFEYELCTICGAQRRRYWNGGNAYLQPDGTYKAKAPECDPSRKGSHPIHSGSFVYEIFQNVIFNLACDHKCGFRFGQFTTTLSKQ